MWQKWQKRYSGVPACACVECRPSWMRRPWKARWEWAWSPLVITTEILHIALTIKRLMVHQKSKKKTIKMYIMTSILLQNNKKWGGMMYLSLANQTKSESIAYFAHKSADLLCSLCTWLKMTWWKFDKKLMTGACCGWFRQWSWCRLNTKVVSLNNVALVFHHPRQNDVLEWDHSLELHNGTIPMAETTTHSSHHLLLEEGAASVKFVISS